MNYHYQKVDWQLAEYVFTVLVFDPNSGSEGSGLPLFTNGSSALLCREDNHITLFGEAVPEEQWKTGYNANTIVFFFKPFALATIFKLSAKALKTKPVELNLWNAQKAMALTVQLCHSRSAAEKVDILSHFIFTQIQSNQRDCENIRYATDEIMQDPGADILSQLPEKLNLTERTFQRLFKKYVGVTANEYRRICQHYFAFAQLKGGHFHKLTDIVYANGYFDQSHFIRSFKEFTNTTPHEYLRSGLEKEK